MPNRDPGAGVVLTLAAAVATAAGFGAGPARAQACLALGSRCGKGATGEAPVSSVFEETCCSGFCGADGRCGCPPGTSQCGRSCVDGADASTACVCLPMGDACAASADCCGPLICRGSPAGNVCSCREDETACGERCCPRGQTCCGERCVATAGDPSHCGGCGNACAAGQTCRECSGPGAGDWRCLTDGEGCLAVGDVWGGTVASPDDRCRAVGETCPAGARCCAGTACGRDGTCGSCARLGDPCRADAECCAGAACSGLDGTCRPCTPAGAPCVAVRCCAGLTCAGDTAGRSAVCQ